MIPEGSKPNFHESVQKRVQHSGLEYKPKAKCRQWRRDDSIDRIVNYVQ